MNPATTTNASQSGLTTVYEQAVQHNYDAEEKKILIQHISMVKSLASQLSGMQPFLQQVVDSHIFNSIQKFNKTILLDYCEVAAKKKKGTATLLKSVNEALFDSIVESKTNASASKERSNPISPAQVFNNLIRSCYLLVRSWTYYSMKNLKE